jgi:hypothetical protein
LGGLGADSDESESIYTETDLAQSKYDMSVRTYEKGVFRNSIVSKDKDGSNRSSNASLVSASGFSRKGKKTIAIQKSEHYTIGELKEEETD